MTNGKGAKSGPRTSFRGTLEQLQYLVALTEVLGAWEWMATGYWCYRCRSGAILNWWPSTGTINFQGPAQQAAELRYALIHVLRCGDSASNKMLEHRTAASPGGES